MGVLQSSGKPRVILADDHTLLLEAFEKLASLRPNATSVAKVPDGRALVAAVREHHPDVVVLDLSNAAAQWARGGASRSRRSTSQSAWSS